MFHVDGLDSPAWLDYSLATANVVRWYHKSLEQEDPYLRTNRAGTLEVPARLWDMSSNQGLPSSCMTHLNLIDQFCKQIRKYKVRVSVSAESAKRSINPLVPSSTSILALSPIYTPILNCVLRNECSAEPWILLRRVIR